MTDTTKLSKNDLIARVAELELQATQTAPVAPLAVSGTVDITALMQSIIAAKGAEAHLPEDRTYKVINAKSITLGLECADPRTGQLKQYLLVNQGDFVMLTRGQIEDLQSRNPALFDDGNVAVPEVVTMNANTIPDLEAFVRNLAFDDIESRITAITSASTLWCLFHHIESQRFVTTDNHGEPLMAGVGKDATRVVQEVRLDPKRQAIVTEVKRRIEATQHVKVSLDGK